jgi:TolA-binding protein
MAAVLLILLLGVGLAAALVWLARTLRELRADWSTQLSDRSAEVDRHLIGVTETMDRRLSELDTKVDRRLENASQTTNKIHERLGKVDEATTQMLERAKDLARLEQALRPPKARGGFGETGRDDQARCRDRARESCREREGDGEPVRHSDDHVTDGIARREVVLDVGRSWHGVLRRGHAGAPRVAIVRLVAVPALYARDPAI